MLFLAAFFVRSKNHHGGSFVASEAIVTSYLASPGFCHARRDGLRVHIVHDAPLSRNYTRFRFAAFFPVGSHPNITSNEFRFLVFRDHLRARRADADAHIYLTDLADVTVLMPPPPLRAGELAVASDAQGARRWLWEKGQRIGYAKEDAYMRALRNGSAFVYNCGIVGGRADALRAFLDALVAELAAFWARRPVQDTCFGADMFIANRLLAAAAAAPLTGHPRGPVNLPMWAVVPGCSAHACRHEFLRRTMGTYWFGHKIPPTWTAVFRRAYCAVATGDRSRT
jgi:hypothetical protein